MICLLRMRNPKTYRVTATETSEGRLDIKNVEVLNRVNQYKQEYKTTSARSVRGKTFTVK
jgi:hypothetical protein